MHARCRRLCALCICLVPDRVTELSCLRGQIRTFICRFWEQICALTNSACAGNDASVGLGEQILISIGTKYSMYCANIARTYLVDPSAKQEEAYKLLMEAQEAAIAALVEGAPMSAAPRAAIDYLTVSPA